MGFERLSISRPCGAHGMALKTLREEWPHPDELFDPHRKPLPTAVRRPQMEVARTSFALSIGKEVPSCETRRADEQQIDRSTAFPGDDTTAVSWTLICYVH